MPTLFQALVHDRLLLQSYFRGSWPRALQKSCGSVCQVWGSSCEGSWSRAWGFLRHDVGSWSRALGSLSHGPWGCRQASQLVRHGDWVAINFICRARCTTHHKKQPVSSVWAPRATELCYRLLRQCRQQSYHAEAPSRPLTTAAQPLQLPQRVHARHFLPSQAGASIENNVTSCPITAPHSAPQGTSKWCTCGCGFPCPYCGCGLHICHHGRHSVPRRGHHSGSSP